MAGRITAYAIIIAGVTTAIWLMVRNEPFREPMLAFALRVFLTLAAGVAARVIPGMFSLQFSESEAGKKITATGAIGFAALTYLTAPVVAPNLDPENIQQRPPEVLPCRVWTPTEYVVQPTQTSVQRPQSARVQWVGWFVDAVHKFEQRQQAKAEREKLLKPDDNPMLDIGLSYRPMIIAETTRFRNPYEAFNAVVRLSVPAKAPHHEAGAHRVIAFLIRGADNRKTFTPLVSLFSPSVETSIIHVPETRRGDYLLLLIWLNPDNDVRERLNDGKAIKGDNTSLQLFVL